MQDLRLAIRALRTTPIVTAVAVVSLALGIGANTAIFSLVNSLILRSLPVVEPQRLAIVSYDGAIRQRITATWPHAVWEQIRQHGDLFERACAWLTERFNLAEHGGESQPVDGIFVTGDYFSMLGVQPVIGLTFSAADDMRGGGKDGAVAVISYSLWQRRFGGSSTVVGTPIVVERVPFTIVGVMPPAFFGAEVGRSFDVALPLSAEPLIRGKDSRLAPDKSYYGLTVLFRLKHGQSIEQANALLRSVQPQIREAAMPPGWPPPLQKSFLKEAFTLLPAASGASRLRDRYERPLAVIFVVVGLVLLIACANIANLQLARTVARRHEIGVRVALGASRFRLARQWLVESVLLSALGAVLGFAVAWWGSRLVIAQLSSAVNRVYLDLTIDWAVLLFTAAVALGTAMLFGTWPALRAARVAPIDALSDQGRGTSSQARASISNGLVIVQVAQSLVLVVGAGLFVRTFENLATLPLGIDGDRVLLVNLNVMRTRIATDDRVPFFHRVVDSVSGVPGVANATVSLTTPIASLSMVDLIKLPDRPLSFEFATDGKLAPNSTFANAVTPQWFATYGVPLKQGRNFDARDVKESMPVIVVNDAFVRKFLAGRSPIGATVELGSRVTKTVVGVVGDSVYGQLRSAAVPIEYSPLSQLQGGAPPNEATLSVRTHDGPPLSVARGISAALGALDPDLTFTFRPLRDQISASLTQERLVAMLSGFFGLLALLLAGLGLYGVTSYAVRRRQIEIGIRMAIGAAPAGIQRLVLARVAALVGAGVLAGTVASLFASRSVTALLYGLEPTDPATLALSILVLATVAALAGWIPAYRASRIDPSDVLRNG